MFRIGKSLVSEEILENNFQCNISKCKGACCVEGIAGAPLEINEAKSIEKDFDKISKYLLPRAVKIVKSKGKYITTKNGKLLFIQVRSKSLSIC